MTATLNSNSLPRRGQRGAALVIGLILLVVVTVLAISGMNTATTELAMARNAQVSENAFQAAETGIEIALAQPSFPTDTPLAIQETVTPFESVDIGVSFERETIVTDRAFSLGVGSGISAFHFVAESDATSARGGANRQASALHTQAFYIIGPQGNTL
jgi:type IV pilus assembly protein PilX